MFYNPIFHNDNSITYWLESFGWVHRAHPSNVSSKTLHNWRAQDVRKWKAAMLKRGFIQRDGKWIPEHKLTET